MRNPSVLHVFKVRTRPQVGNFVVVSYTIYVIYNHVFWDFAVAINPSQPMGKVNFFSNSYRNVPMRGFGANYDAHFSSLLGNFPSESTRFFVVAKIFLDEFVNHLKTLPTNLISIDKIANRDVQGVDLSHLGYRPGPLLPVPAHHAALVAGLAQGYHCVVQTLLHMVGVRGAWGAAYAAGQLLDQRYMPALIGGVRAIHVTTLSNALLLASWLRHTSIRAWADTNPHL